MMNNNFNMDLKKQNLSMLQSLRKTLKLMNNKNDSDSNNKDNNNNER